MEKKSKEWWDSQKATDEVLRNGTPKAQQARRWLIANGMCPPPSWEMRNPYEKEKKEE